MNVASSPSRATQMLDGARRFIGPASAVLRTLAKVGKRFDLLKPAAKRLGKALPWLNAADCFVVTATNCQKAYRTYCGGDRRGAALYAARGAGEALKAMPQTVIAGHLVATGAVVGLYLHSPKAPALPEAMPDDKQKTSEST